ncbi:hypothetical protein PH547_20665 [Rhizobium sp. CNPSo 3464]|uniref:hypothetical protein n=2 Tax=Rhizobium sp. CNPSo 3464 TaxID=3021406 RepID=UPI00254E8CAE|nr:hypothetical protein [Rhizobium sp. CNPSo 3464]MDK4741305.1 hypothetical protein [Rhizobium sp. CNPSo 3464]
MARSMHIYTIENVAAMIGENLELLQEIAANSDNIDYGEMVRVHNGTEDGTTGFTDRGVECLEEFLADVRTWDGGIRQFLVGEQCDPEMIERVMADELSRKS